MKALIEQATNAAINCNRKYNFACAITDGKVAHNAEGVAWSLYIWRITPKALRDKAQG
jgi:hypothetical protein